MNVTHPPQNIWAKMQKDFKQAIKQKKELDLDQYNPYFEIEDPILFYYQLETANEFVEEAPVLAEMYLLQIPNLLWALELNISTQISMLILNLLDSLLNITRGETHMLIEKNMGLKILLERVQDQNIDIVRMCTKVFSRFIEDYFLSDNFIHPLLQVLCKLDSYRITEIPLIELIVSICENSDSFSVYREVCATLLQLNDIQATHLIKFLRRLLNQKLFRDELVSILIYRNFIDRIKHIKNSDYDVFVVLYALAKHCKNSEYFLQHDALSYFEIPVDNFCQYAQLYSRALSLLSLGNYQITRNIIKNRVILDNLFRLKHTDCVTSLIVICNNVIDLKLQFELQYLISKDILYKYYELLNTENINNQILALIGLKQLAKFKHLDNQLIRAQKYVHRLKSSKNSDVINLVKEVLNEFRKLKEGYF